MAVKDLEKIGPSQTAGGDPPNPQDRLFSGALPIKTPAQVSLRRPFSEPTRPPLHYSDGPGPDEGVTSRRPAVAPNLGYQAAQDAREERPLQGKDLGQVPNTTHTTNGVVIRGS